MFSTEKKSLVAVHNQVVILAQHHQRVMVMIVVHHILKAKYLVQHAQRKPKMF